MQKITNSSFIVFYSFFNKFAAYILGIWLLILSFSYSFLSLIKHANYQSGAFDLGIFDQAIWQYSRFIYPYNTIKERFILGDHFTLTLPLFAPLYWVWDNVSILLIAQAFWITFSALAIYKITLLRKLSPFIAVAISIMYSLFYGIQFGLYSDWHPVIFGVGLLVWLAYFFESKKKKMFWITLILCLFTQENMGIAVAGLGLFYFFKKQYRNYAIALVLLGISVSLIEVALISRFSSVGYQYSPKVNHNPIKIITQFFDTSDKIKVWLYSFLHFSFLPILSIGALLAIIFDLSQYFVASNDYPGMLTPYTHHRAILDVFLSLGTIDALLILKKTKINITILTLIMLCMAVSQQYFFHFPLNKLIKREYWQKTKWMKNNDMLLTSLPNNASIATTQDIVPHLSHRKEIYLVWPHKKVGKEAYKLCKLNSCYWLDFAGKPQYLLVNVDNTQWITQLLETPQNFNEAVNNMEKTKKIQLVRSVDTARLFRIIY